MTTQYPQLFELTVAERLRLLEELWDSIASSTEPVPVPDWQKEELAKRKAARFESGQAATPWEEVQERIRRDNE